MKTKNKKFKSLTSALTFAVKPSNQGLNLHYTTRKYTCIHTLNKHMHNELLEKLHTDFAQNNSRNCIRVGHSTAIRATWC